MRRGRRRRRTAQARDRRPIIAQSRPRVWGIPRRQRLHGGAPRRADRGLRRDVERDGAQAEALLRARSLGRAAAQKRPVPRRGRMALLNVAHRGGDRATGPGRRLDGPSAKRRQATLTRGVRPVWLSGVSAEAPAQTMPPLARRTWPLIQPPSGPARKATALAMSSGRPRRSSGDIRAS